MYFIREQRPNKDQERRTRHRNRKGEGPNDLRQKRIQRPHRPEHNTFVTGGAVSDL